MLNATPVNADLIGIEGSARHLDTPALVLDLPAFRRNVRRMRDRIAGTAVTLRPHAKTHKCAQIAKIQIVAGAQGICTAKLAEAEALAREGLSDILVTSPIVGMRPIRRLMALNARLDRLAVVADDADAIAALTWAAEASGRRLTVFLDLDVGTHRTGALPAEAAALAGLIAEAPFLRFGGVQAYGGHLQHLHGAETRSSETRAMWRVVADVVDHLRENGIPCPTVTGGGTGTHEDDLSAGVLTELQGGSYIFMDREYADLEDAPAFEQALFVYTRVISRRQKAFVTTDAGIKAFATDGPLPTLATGPFEGARYFLQGDEYGGIVLGAGKNGAGGARSDAEILSAIRAITAMNMDDTVPAPARSVGLGTLVACAVPHCDPTVNLYDHIHVIEDNCLMAIWPVIARGASQ
ncbi:MAG: alanine racemase [Alphaproteobacteria bacterium]